MLSTRLPIRTSTPSCCSARRVARGQVLGEGRQDARRGLHQDHPGRRRVDAAELVFHAEARQLGDGAGEFHPGRTAADDQEGEQAAPLARVVRRLGPLEGGEQAPPHLGGILDALQAGRVGRPIVAAEIAVGGAGGEHQIVVADALAGHQHFAPRRIHAGHFAEQHAHVELLAEQAAHRRGDVARGEPRGRHLIEQRLEQVVVVAVDQRHGDAGAGRAPRRRPCRRSRRRRSPPAAGRPARSPACRGAADRGGAAAAAIRVSSARGPGPRSASRRSAISQ